MCDAQNLHRRNPKRRAKTEAAARGRELVEFTLDSIRWHDDVVKAFTAPDDFVLELLDKWNSLVLTWYDLESNHIIADLKQIRGLRSSPVIKTVIRELLKKLRKIEKDGPICPCGTCPDCGCDVCARKEDTWEGHDNGPGRCQCTSCVSDAENGDYYNGDTW